MVTVVCRGSLYRFQCVTTHSDFGHCRSPDLDRAYSTGLDPNETSGLARAFPLQNCKTDQVSRSCPDQATVSRQRAERVGRVRIFACCGGQA